MPQSGQECCTGTQPCTQLAPLPQSLPTPHGTAQAMLSHPEWQSLAWPDPCLAALPWGGRPRRYPDRSCVAGPPLPGPPASWPAALAAARRSRRAWARACMVSLKRRRSSSAISRVRAVLSLAPAQEVGGMGGGGGLSALWPLIGLTITTAWQQAVRACQCVRAAAVNVKQQPSTELLHMQQHLQPVRLSR